ncbi:hypothetical protein ES703_107062 [subsurface metagenome]
MASRISKVTDILKRVLRRTHPDVYEAVKEYASEKNIRIGDVVAASVSSYLSADDEGKDVLEKALAERKGGGGGGTTGIKTAVSLFKDMCEAMSTMFTTLNTAKSNLSAASIVADYKAIATAAEEIKKVGSEGGSGSIGDSLADAFVRNIIETGLGGKLRKKKSTRTTGKTPVEKLD